MALVSNVLNLGENSTDKDGKSSRSGYLKKWKKKMRLHIKKIQNISLMI